MADKSDAVPTGKQAPKIKLVGPAKRHAANGNKRKKQQSGPQKGSSKRPKTSRKPYRRKANPGKSNEHLLKSLLFISQKSEYTEKDRERQETQLKHAELMSTKRVTKAQETEEDCGNGLYQVQGMNTLLRDYQLCGAAFMLRIERSKMEPRGGILADEMGIGKTVQTIACMQTNQKRKATLIVVPSHGLMEQWGSELVNHLNVDQEAKENTYVYSGPGKATAVGLRAYRFVLATYSQVQQEYKLYIANKPDKPAALFKVEWYRIVLDEGDNIKNFYGSTSIACSQLQAQNKWVLSGTPLRNHEREALPYFRFIGIDMDQGKEDFEAKWGRLEKDDEHTRIMKILSIRMLRREAGEMFLGRQICKLPAEHIIYKKVSLTEEEEVITKHIQESILEDTRNARLQCTRLRQAADHPFLLEICAKHMKTERLTELISELKGLKQPSTHKSPSDQNNSSDDFGDGEFSMHMMAMDMVDHLNDTLACQNNDGCLECFGTTGLQRLDCGDIICRACWQDYRDDSTKQKKTTIKCPNCQKVAATIQANDDGPVATEPPSGQVEDLEAETVSTANGRSVSVVPINEAGRRCPGDDMHNRQPKMGSAFGRWLKHCDQKRQVTPSTKTVEAIKIVVDWQKTAPEDKIIVFTEWNTTAKVLGRLLERQQVKFLYYWGDMSQKFREYAIRRFETVPEVTVLIASIRAANVGLNLNCANRVIIMNPWWNAAAETQAFGRVKRHGQTKETYLVCLIARNTIDERIKELQDKKAHEIRLAMTEGRKPKPLSKNEERWLLGDRTIEGIFDDSEDDVTLQESKKDDGSGDFDYEP
ncbi:P-loop containing nucleoside triphosphate hydrolase protein [Xylariaceae sp. FL0255]|nr:P-loop containing nucleoside triphosphate hydrolase protein [Xylariaceae sp. FL0255]